MGNVVNTAQLKDYIGKEVGVTDWVEIDQDRINKFAQTPFGTTIAHGFLTLSMIPMLSAENGGLKLENTVMGINYGLDKVRFINPVKVGNKIRGRFTLTGVEEKKPNHFLLKHTVTIEIEGEEKPALIAESLGMTVIG